MKLIATLALVCAVVFTKAQDTTTAPSSGSGVPEECNTEAQTKCIDDVHSKYTLNSDTSQDDYCAFYTEASACIPAACCATDFMTNQYKATQAQIDATYKSKGWSGSCKPACGVCFSNDQMTDVKALDGSISQVAMKDLKIGDSVRVEGDKFEKVFAFSHNDKDADALMVRFTTDHGVVQMSPDHYVRANGVMKPAGEVQQSEFLHHYNGTILQVRKIEKVFTKGLHAPHTKSGEIAVGGHIASCYTKSIKPSIGHAFLQPWAKLFDAGFEQAGHFLTSIMSNDKVRATAMKYFGEH